MKVHKYEEMFWALLCVWELFFSFMLMFWVTLINKSRRSVLVPLFQKVVAKTCDRIRVIKSDRSNKL